MPKWLSGFLFECLRLGLAEDQLGADFRPYLVAVSREHYKCRSVSVFYVLSWCFVVPVRLKVGACPFSYRKRLGNFHPGIQAVSAESLSVGCLPAGQHALFKCDSWLFEILRAERSFTTVLGWCLILSRTPSTSEVLH